MFLIDAKKHSCSQITVSPTSFAFLSLISRRLKVISPRAATRDSSTESVVSDDGLRMREIVIAHHQYPNRRPRVGNRALALLQQGRAARP